MKLIFEDVEVKFYSEAPNGNRFEKMGLASFVQKFLGSLKIMIKKKLSLRKLIAAILTGLMLLVQNPAGYAVAQTAPTAPTAPTPPPQPENTVTLPPEPTPPSEPTPPPEPTAPVAPTAPTTPTATTYETYVTPTPLPLPTTSSSSSSGGGAGSTSSTSGGSGSSTAQLSPTSGTGSQNQNGQSGGTTIATGDANNVGNISTSANSNIGASPQISGSGSGAQVINSGNGSNSTNSGSVGIVDTDTNLQTNSAIVGSNLNQNTTSGNNSASMNTGGDNLIQTGDANTTGTIITAVNTNLDGVAVYEFNIVDDYTGDYILDFSSANCISGCATGDALVKNEGNGANSTNTGDLNLNSIDNTFQTNDAEIVNNMNLASVSGENSSNMNTGGDNTIISGDANTSGSIVNMVNNNISGGVIYAVVNVFGDLVGDIILPDGSVLACCSGSATAVNSGNGASSTNSTNIDQNQTSNTAQFNNVDIQNNLVLDANTGGNDANKNTDGSSVILTGESNLVAQVFNVANTNLVGGNLWLVLVNEAGRWIGKIIGADGQNYSGSDTFEFIVNESGEITAVNSGNGANSTNTSNVTQNSTSNTVQTNDAQIVNNVNLSAVSGGNDANYNTGGNNTIMTGDANVIASIVNFVNNNIVGGGKLFVTVINVFGSWIGDFVGPGQVKENSAGNHALGGQSSGFTSSNESTTADAENNSQEDSGQEVSNSSNLLSFVFGRGKTSAGGTLSVEDDASAAVSSVDESGPVAGKKVIRINLAWFTPLIPLAVFIFIRKRKLFIRSNSPVQAAA